MLSFFLTETFCQYTYNTYNTGDYSPGTGGPTGASTGGSTDYPTYPDTTTDDNPPVVVTNPPPQTTLQPASSSLSGIYSFKITDELYGVIVLFPAVLELILLLPIILQFLTPYLGIGGNPSSGSGSGSAPAIPSVPPLSGRPSLQGGYNFYPHPLFSTGGNLFNPLMFFPRRGPNRLRRTKVNINLVLLFMKIFNY